MGNQQAINYSLGYEENDSGVFDANESFIGSISYNPLVLDINTEDQVTFGPQSITSTSTPKKLNDRLKDFSQSETNPSDKRPSNLFKSNSIGIRRNSLIRSKSSINKTSRIEDSIGENSEIDFIDHSIYSVRIKSLLIINKSRLVEILVYSSQKKIIKFCF